MLLGKEHQFLVSISSCFSSSRLCDAPPTLSPKIIATTSLLLFPENLTGYSCLVVSCALPHHLDLGRRVAAAGSRGSAQGDRVWALGSGLSFEP